jgi:ubiquinone/menaquinone biosynthesis C-methylase UbiE
MRIEEERFYMNGFMPPWVRYQHLERYHWAAEFVEGKRVLDVACGTGYGTVHLANARAAQVDGFDCSREAINFAKHSWALPNAAFALAAANYLPVADASYDVYISFETIEHVEDDDALLREATRVLKPDGLLLVSTPNRDLLDPGISIDDKPFNRFHIREYCHDEFAEKLKKYFGSISWYGQRRFSPGYIALLQRIGRQWPAIAVKVHQARKCLGWPWEYPQRHTPSPSSGQPVFDEVLIAVCHSGASIPEQYRSPVPASVALY